MKFFSIMFKKLYNLLHKNTQKPNTQNFSLVHIKRVNVAFKFLQLQKKNKKQTRSKKY